MVKGEGNKMNHHHHHHHHQDMSHSLSEQLEVIPVNQWDSVSSWRFCTWEEWGWWRRGPAINRMGVVVVEERGSGDYSLSIQHNYKITWFLSSIREPNRTSLEPYRTFIEPNRIAISRSQNKSYRTVQGVCSARARYYRARAEPNRMGNVRYGTIRYG